MSARRFAAARRAIARSVIPRLDTTRFAIARFGITPLVIAPLVLAMVLSLGLVSCAKVPVESIERVRTAVEGLYDADARTWAPVELDTVEEAVSAVNRELKEQASRFAFMRRYHTLEVLLETATEEIEIAHEAVEAGKDRARGEASEALESAASAVESARTAMLLAPISRGPRSAFDRLDKGLERAERLLGEARVMMQDERYAEAIDQAERILTLVAARVRDVQKRPGS